MYVCKYYLKSCDSDLNIGINILCIDLKGNSDPASYVAPQTPFVPPPERLGVPPSPYAGLQPAYQPQTSPDNDHNMNVAMQQPQNEYGNALTE